MTTVQAGLTYYKQVNEQVRSISDSEITIENAIGQRYLPMNQDGTAGPGCWLDRLPE